jgi:hypothetical protein
VGKIIGRTVLISIDTPVEGDCSDAGRDTGDLKP